MSNPIADSAEYELIVEFYGDRRAKRSGQLYMKHIDDGIEMLDKANADEDTMRAFAIHPIVQDLNSRRAYAVLLNELKPTVLFLATEYASVANEYLSKHCSGGPDDFVPTSPVRQVNLMLLVDKMQNAQDLLAHNPDHPKFDLLVQYFTNWISALQRVLVSD